MYKTEMLFENDFSPINWLLKKDKKQVNTSSIVFNAKAIAKKDVYFLITVPIAHVHLIDYLVCAVANVREEIVGTV